MEICDTVKTLEAECFMGSGLKSVSIPKAVERIMADAFRDCEQLGEIVFSSEGRLKAIESKAFSGTGISEFAAPDSLVSLG